MGYYRRLINDAFRRYNRKTSPVESFSSRCDPTRSSRTLSQPILRNVVNNNQRKSPFFDGAAKRFYNAADRYRGFRRRYQNRRNLSFLCVNGVVISVIYCWNLETVPYTKRRHFVLVSDSLEKKIGNLVFELLKDDWRILASNHPESIRVQKIGRDIIGGLRKGLDKWEDDEHTSHLEEFKCEFFVVDDPTMIECLYIPGGKIVVFTGLLYYLKTDVEIATIIAHEVGHVVARHGAELLSGSLAYRILIYSLPKGSLLYHLLISSLPDRHEMEADYIGMLISASAGYDPRTAPEVFRKLGELFDGVNERAEILSQPKVMDEALAIYRETLSDKEKANDGSGPPQFF